MKKNENPPCRPVTERSDQTPMVINKSFILALGNTKGTAIESGDEYFYESCSFHSFNV
jgi:hypothetical protein